QDNKADVRAIMARFQANGSNSEEAPSANTGHPKQPLHPTLSGQASHMKRPVSDGPPGSGKASVPPKPSFLKNSPLSKSDPVAQDQNRTKALANVFSNSQGEVNKPFLKQPSFSQIAEPKAPLNKPLVTGSDPKPTPPKPAVISTKPTWVKKDPIPSASPSVSKIPPAMLKPSNNFYKLQQQIEGKAEVIADTANKPTLPVNVTAKPNNFRTAQNLFNKDPPEQPDGGVKPSVNNVPPPKPHSSKKPSVKKPSPHINDDNPSTPKRNPLPNSLALGPAPAKPNRPPKVNLEVFKKESETQAEGKTITPPSHPSNRVTPASPAVPSLPPRHPGAAEQKREKKKEKDDKAEKKRLEADKKEQRERERKNKRLRRSKVRMDFKGYKTDLSLKQGDSLDIIRILGNPEGKWLGRTEDGSIGYVQTSLVDIDYDALKQKKLVHHACLSTVVLPPVPGDEEEIYDDVDSSQDVNPQITVQGCPNCFNQGAHISLYTKGRALDSWSMQLQYKSEIKVQHQVTIIPNLTNKKWSTKELPLKSGEKLDVIVQAVDNKFICRNEDGKCEFCTSLNFIILIINAYCIYDND
uniref:SH3 domain-containing protein n=1 Tax=Neogobius melanostomus TaxID=47308 RepID=A0A8C6UGJ6_9GOBI